MISRETGDTAPAAGDVGLHGDFGLLSPVSASPSVAALTGDRAVLAAILRVEAAWAAVLEQARHWPRPVPPRWSPRPPRWAATTSRTSPCAPRAAATR